jgi:DNA-binding response OmpR family regulator
VAERSFTELSVLLVEDESLVAMLMEDMLERLGFRRIVAVSRVAAAKEALRREGCDLAILDINIAGEAVFPFALLLAGRGVPFFFVTGYGGGEVPKSLRDRKVLRKPFPYDGLRAAISETLAGRRTDAETPPTRDES